ncbi:MAG: hypothetical protein ACN4GW_03795, partial [Desulforhopalus sp.]
NVSAQLRKQKKDEAHKGLVFHFFAVIPATWVLWVQRESTSRSYQLNLTSTATAVAAGTGTAATARTDRIH